MTSFYKIVSIEGNIGSGKSTLLEILRQHYSSNTRVIFLREPVDDWEKIKDNEGNTMLKKFYADQEKYSFAFQMMAYISRLKILRDVVNKITIERNNLVQEKMKNMFVNYDEKENYYDFPKYVIITERSLYTDKHVFAKMLHDQGKIEDVCYQIYLTWFDEFAKDFPINYSVYVNTIPQKCYERIHKRARDGEEVIPLGYLDECHNYHEKFLDENTGIKTEKIVLDGNVDIYKNEKIVEEWLEKIDTFIGK
jgi:deoxyadenosine/deoxycytidine kinase